MLSVDRAQAILSELGYDPGPHDGVLGPKTSMAISAFQSDYGLPQTGTLDVLTTERLMAVAIEKGVDRKMPWWGWAMIAVGASLALWGAYKLATHKRGEREEALLRKLSGLRPTDAILPVHRPQETSWPSHQEAVSSTAPTVDFTPSSRPRWPSESQMYLPERSPASLPPTVILEEPPPTTIRDEGPPTLSTMEGPQSVPFTNPHPSPQPYIESLPPPPRRATLAEMLDIQAEAERRARVMTSPKSGRYGDVLENERRRVIRERLGK